jgi:predicted cupin superfamily sugar epimerase
MDISIEEINTKYQTVVTKAAGQVPENENREATIDSLKLIPHIEGGYFVETDRDTHLTVNDAGEERSMSTSIFYFITPKTPIGAFHRNLSPTVHTLHHGRGIYIVMVPLGPGGSFDSFRVETFVVGHDIAHGERLQWIVEGGCYKASFLIPQPAEDGLENSPGLLISEVRFPPFCCLCGRELIRNRLLSPVLTTKIMISSWRTISSLGLVQSCFSSCNG